MTIFAERIRVRDLAAAAAKTLQVLDAARTDACGHVEKEQRVGVYDNAQFLELREHYTTVRDAAGRALRELEPVAGDVGLDPHRVNHVAALVEVGGDDVALTRALATALVAASIRGGRR